MERKKYEVIVIEMCLLVTFCDELATLKCRGLTLLHVSCFIL